MVDVHVAPEVASAASERITGALPVASLLSLRRRYPKGIVGVNDVVLDAVTGRLADPLLPLFAQPRIVGTLAEGALCPRGRDMHVMLGKLIADLSVLSRELGECALQPVALGADLVRLAQLACEAARCVSTASSSRSCRL